MAIGLSSGGRRWEARRTNYNGKPQLLKEEERDWGCTGGKDGNVTVEARRRNAKTCCQ